MPYRIGIGYDIHRLSEGRKLCLGGVEIPYIKGLLGHSDGDALLHAICDALLGAMGAGDIGEHFPDTDPAYHGICSVKLLEQVIDQSRKANYRILNLDTVIIAQEPLLAPFKEQIQNKVAEILKIDKGLVNIKAKTNEGLGEIGSKEAIAAYAAAILVREG